jgi:hypothetical protein
MARFWNRGNAEAKGPDGEAQQNGFRAAFLGNRKRHFAQAKGENAVDLFWAQKSQTSWWMENYELAREIRHVISDPKFKQAVVARFGENALKHLSTKVDAIEGNGIATAHDAANSVVNTYLGYKAGAVLAWNVGTYMMQATASIAATMVMSPVAFVRSIASLRPSKVKAMFDSPIIRAGGDDSPGREAGLPAWLPLASRTRLGL